MVVFGFFLAAERNPQRGARLLVGGIPQKAEKPASLAFEAEYGILKKTPAALGPRPPPTVPNHPVLTPRVSPEGKDDRYLPILARK